MLVGLACTPKVLGVEDDCLSLGAVLGFEWQLAMSIIAAKARAMRGAQRPASGSSTGLTSERPIGAPPSRQHGKPWTETRSRVRPTRWSRGPRHRAGQQDGENCQFPSNCSMREQGQGPTGRRLIAGQAR